MRSRKKNYSFPPQALLERAREELSAPGYKGGSQGLPENASELERAKYEVCQVIAKYLRVHELKQRELAEKLGIDESRMSDILRGKIAGFTLDRLLGYGQILHPGLRLKIIAA